MFGVHAGELDDIDYAALEVGYLKRKKRREGSHDYFIFQQEQKAIPPHRVNTEYKKKRLETQAKTFVYKDFLHITSSNCFNTCTSLPQAEEPSAESILCFHHCTDRFFEARDIVLAGYLEYVGGISLVPKEVAAQELVQQIPILQRYSQDIARIPFMNEPEKRDPYGWAKKE